MDIDDDIELSDDDEVDDNLVTRSLEEITAETDGVLNSLTASEKIDSSLVLVGGLDTHDVEMDEIARKAMSTFDELRLLGANVADMYVGKVYEVAGQVLKTALDAKNAKVNKKLKMIDLQIKKLRVDKYADDSGTAGAGSSGLSQEFDRNELLKHFASIEVEASEGGYRSGKDGNGDGDIDVGDIATDK